MIKEQNVAFDPCQKECRKGTKNACCEPQLFPTDHNAKHSRDRAKTH